MNNKLNNFSRRQVLRYSAGALPLPYLSSLARAENTAKAPKRLCFIYCPNGVSLPPQNKQGHEDWHWFPHQTGKDFQFTESLKPLENFRSKLSIISGLSHPNFRTGIEAHSTADFYLNGLDQAHGYHTGITCDQVYAETQMAHTRFSSLVLSSTGGIGTPGRSSTLSFARSGQAIPSLFRPQQIFNRLFGVDNTPIEIQRRGLKVTNSILDHVIQSANKLSQSISVDDRVRFEEYTHSIRQLEQQNIRAEQWLDVAKPTVDRQQFNLDVEPDESQAEDYMRSIYDLIHMAFVTDSTRVATYMIDPEKGNGNGNRFPLAIGKKHHHALSHDTGVKDGYVAWARYDQWLAKQLAYLLTKLDSTPEPSGEGSILDNTLLVFGSGSSTAHTTKNFPTLLVGGNRLGINHGTFHDFKQDDKEQPFNNLLYTLLAQLGLESDGFGDSTGLLTDLIQV